MSLIEATKLKRRLESPDAVVRRVDNSPMEFLLDVLREHWIPILEGWQLAKTYNYFLPDYTESVLTVDVVYESRRLLIIIHSHTDDNTYAMLELDYDTGSGNLTLVPRPLMSYRIPLAFPVLPDNANKTEVNRTQSALAQIMEEVIMVGDDHPLVRTKHLAPVLI